MRFAHKIKIGKKEFHIDNNCILQRDYYRQLLDIRENKNSKIMKILEGFFHNVEAYRDPMICAILQIMEEPLKNSFDACKDNYLQNNDFIGAIIINVVINTKRQVLTIIVKDNGSGINSVDSMVKENNKDYIGGDGIGLDPITKNRTDSFRMEIDYNGAIVMLRKKYELF